MNKVELEKIKQKALDEHIPIIMDHTWEVISNVLNDNKLLTSGYVSYRWKYSHLVREDYETYSNMPLLIDIANLFLNPLDYLQDF